MYKKLDIMSSGKTVTFIIPGMPEVPSKKSVTPAPKTSVPPAPKKPEHSAPPAPKKSESIIGSPTGSPTGSSLARLAALRKPDATAPELRYSASASAIVSKPSAKPYLPNIGKNESGEIPDWLAYDLQYREKERKAGSTSAPKSSKDSAHDHRSTTPPCTFRVPAHRSEMSVCFGGGDDESDEDMVDESAVARSRADPRSLVGLYDHVNSLSRRVGRVENHVHHLDAGLAEMREQTSQAQQQTLLMFKMAERFESHLSGGNSRKALPAPPASSSDSRPRRADTEFTKDALPLSPPPFRGSAGGGAASAIVRPKPSEVPLRTFMDDMGFTKDTAFFECTSKIYSSGTLRESEMALIRAVISAFEKCGGEPVFGGIPMDVVCTFLFLFAGGYKAITDMRNYPPNFENACVHIINALRQGPLWDAFWHISTDLCANLRDWNLSKRFPELTNEVLRTQEGRETAFTLLVANFF
jgi:hypothetical protein